MRLRLLVCGDRHWKDRALLEREITATQNEFDVDNDELVIIEGEANGADKMARQYAIKHSIFVIAVHADWATYGREAGSIRNRKMLEIYKPERVLAFHDNIEASSGTANMIAQAKDAGVPVTLITHQGRTNL